MVVWYAAEHVYPSSFFFQSRLPPSEVFAYPGMEVFNEYTLYHGWMKLYLEYQRWNCMLRLSASIELEVFMDVPIFIRTYYRPANMDDSFRYGIIFRMYDLAVQLQWGNVMKLLPVTKTQVETKKKHSI